MRACLILAILAAIPPDRPDPNPKGKAVPLLEQMQGEWKLTKATRGDQPEDPQKVTRTTFLIKGDVMHIKEFERNSTEDAKFKLDETKSPIAFDIVPLKDRGNGEKIVVVGILKLDGDTLTICFAHGGRGNRPTEFASPPNTNLSLLELKRMAPKR
jgi:uncharacterized protein (TIGR03067 family)